MRLVAKWGEEDWVEWVGRWVRRGSGRGGQESQARKEARKAEGRGRKEVGIFGSCCK